MTAVDHAELKRLAEAATPGPWESAEVETAVFVRARIGINGQMQRLLRMAITPRSDRRREAAQDAAFIAAANPAVVLALLSEIEGLKAERDEWKNTAEFNERCWSEERGTMIDKISALRTQAPDSWRPISEHDNSADEVLVMRDGWRKPIVAWRHHPSSRTDVWLTVPGKYQVRPTEFHPLPALRPQTAESGK